MKIQPPIESIIHTIETAFQKQLERKFSLDMLIERMNDLKNSIKVSKSKIIGNKFKISTNTYFSNKFHVLRKEPKNKISLETSKFSEIGSPINNDNELTPEKVIEMEFQVLVYLAVFLDEQLSYDYQLDNFYNTIKQNRHGTNQIYL